MFNRSRRDRSPKPIIVINAFWHFLQKCYSSSYFKNVSTYKPHQLHHPPHTTLPKVLWVTMATAAAWHTRKFPFTVHIFGQVDCGKGTFSQHLAKNEILGRHLHWGYCCGSLRAIGSTRAIAGSTFQWVAPIIRHYNGRCIGNDWVGRQLCRWSCHRLK